MNEQHFVYKVRQHLNRGLHDLGPNTLDRLAAARRLALAHQKQVAGHPALAAAGHAAGHFSPFHLPFHFPFHFHFAGLRFSQTLAALAFLLCALYSTFWIADRRAQELGDIDSAILSDELPIGAFTDKGFAAWLNSKSPAE
ncbi:MAG: DUF3619 family protein [Candidatus Accumulibacter sp.]|jgi:hypothetical protein|nr:DUF3619 family protein [Accumulibacter sp.]